MKGKSLGCKGKVFGCGGEVWGVGKVWGVEQKSVVREISLECGGKSEVQEAIVGDRGKLQGARGEYRVQGESLGLRGKGSCVGWGLPEGEEPEASLSSLSSTETNTAAV